MKMAENLCHERDIAFPKQAVRDKINEIDIKNKER